MSRKRHEKKLKRKKRLAVRVKHRSEWNDRFLDRLGSYATEFDRLRRRPPIRSLVGIYELEDEEFYDLTTEQKLTALRLSGMSNLLYDCEYDNEAGTIGRTASGTGYAAPLRVDGQGVRPIIFLRRRVEVDSGSDVDAGMRNEVAATTRLVVLLHELGHAEDIERGVNFDHATLKLDLVSAEAYAHRFACDFARMHNYRLAIRHYLGGIDNHLKSETEYVRLAAERFVETTDVAGLKVFADQVWSEHRGPDYWLAKKRSEKQETSRRRTAR